MKTESKGEHGSALARVLGSGSAGLLELILFHPVDTIAKRLMTNESKIFGNGSAAENLNKAIFKVCCDSTLGLSPPN
jgi:hypothetical protein